MKQLFASIILLSCLNSLALDGKSAPRSNGSGGVQCAWYDAGSHEEHAPHISQQDCLASGHGRCDERCYTYDQVCSVEGSHREYVKDQAGNNVMKDIITRFSGRDRDLWRAQEIAIHNCHMSSVYQENCRITSCTEEANRVR